jgi:cytochrome P450 family 142 subfamily A polypeptide 1
MPSVHSPATQAALHRSLAGAYTTECVPMNVIHPERLAVDVLDPELYRRNPHDTWTWMRANEPVYRDDRNGLWVLTRHADVMEVERRSSVFVSGQGYRVIWSPEEINMIAQDDPRHRQQRMLVQPRLTGKAVGDRRAELAGLVGELIDAIVDGGGETELVGSLAGQLPARFTARLLGFPEEMWPQIKSWSERLMRTDMRERDGGTFSEFFDASMEFAGVLGEIAPDKFADPGDDLLSIWLHARIDGEPLQFSWGPSLRFPKRPCPVRSRSGCAR